MHANRKFLFLPLIAAGVLFLLFALPGAVYAQSELPPVVEPEDAAAAPEGEAPAESSETPIEPESEELPQTAASDGQDLPEAQPTPEPEAPLETTLPPVEPDEIQPTEETTEVAPVEDVPADVVAEPALVVVDENGEALPLASEAAGQALAAPDPYFYVGKVRYSFAADCSGVPGICAQSSTPIQAAFNYIRDNGLSPVGGAVYVEEGEYTENVAIDGFETELVGGVLKLRWKVVPASLALIGVKPAGPGVPEKTVASLEDVILNGSISISNMKSFTLQAFTINGGVLFSGNTGTINVIDAVITESMAGDGLAVTNHSGGINFVGVSSNSNNGDGADLDNTRGPAAPITIKNSAFDRNGDAGLIIHTNGLVTLTGVGFTRNGLTINPGGSYDGADIWSRGLTATQVIFTANEGQGLWVMRHDLGGVVSIQNSQFNGNALSGLVIETDGSVTLKNLRATNNGEYGVYVDTCDWDGVDGDPCRNPSTGSISLSQANVTGNAKAVTDTAAGLNLAAKGAITLTAVYSSENGDDTHLAHGAYLNNSFGSAVWTVNVTGSTLTYNSGAGLAVFSSGLITVKDIAAKHNGDFGAYLENNNENATAGVNVLNSSDSINSFDENTGSGLVIFSNGAVTLNAGQSNGNDMTGIFIQNDSGNGAVVIDGVAGTTAYGNDGNGIHVISKGTITLKNMDATLNGAYGVFLENAAGLAGINVLVTLADWINSLSANSWDGMYLLSNGAIVVNRTSAESNGHYGAYIDNSTGSGDVTITDSQFLGNAQFAVGATDPIESGLYVHSGGNITLTNVYANWNGVEDPIPTKRIAGYGAELDNSATLAPKNVTITNGNFNHNTADGLKIASVGAVTLRTAASSNNGGRGIDIDTHQAVKDQAVTLGQITSEWNGAEGIKVLAKGNISVSDFRVTHNTGEGINLDNSYGTGTITLSAKPAAIGAVKSNTGAGLTINSTRAITLSNFDVSDNLSYGAQVNTVGTVVPVTITNVNFINNSSYGLDVDARGNITLDSVNVTDNDSYGVDLDNSIGLGAVTIKSTVGRSIATNKGYGLSVTSKGAITLTNIEIHNNDGYGAKLDNSQGAGGGVTINNTIPRSFQDNGLIGTGFGLEVKSTGAITINLVDASSNKNRNGFLDNHFAADPAAPGVTITNSNFNASTSGSGLEVVSKGNIVLSAVSANGNLAGNGVFLNNSASGAKGTVSVSGLSESSRADFGANAGYGLKITSNGAVTVKFLSVDDNTGFGAWIDNSTAATSQAVTITSATFHNNSSITPGYGLQVFSRGAITGTSVYASGNGDTKTSIAGHGMLLDNCIQINGNCVGNGGVTLTKAGAHNNRGDGIKIDTFGAITLSSVSAEYNAGNGATYRNSYTGTILTPVVAYAPSTAGVAISLPAGKTAIFGSYSGNGGYGVDISSNGAIAITGMMVNQNLTTNAAARIDNSNAAKPLAVTISKSFFNENAAISGVQVFSKGAISFLNNQVLGNTGKLTVDRSAAELLNQTTLLPQPVTVANTVVSDNSGGSGLFIWTKGNVALTNITANRNGEIGLEVNAVDGVGTITMGGTMNTFLENAGTGVNLTGKGAITVVNILSEMNGLAGLGIDTCQTGEAAWDCSNPITSAIKVSNATLNVNGLHGISGLATGQITLTGITAMGNGYLDAFNGYDGAVLVTKDQDITISGSCFHGNVGMGIEAWTGQDFSRNTLRVVGTSISGNNTRGYVDYFNIINHTGAKIIQ